MEALNLELVKSEDRYRMLFDLGPVAVYSCDAAGVIQNFNRRAAELWGREPALGDSDERFCGSHKLFRPDGSFMPHEQCPMAEVVSGNIPEVRDAEVLIERPDGSRVTVVVNIRPLKNVRGEVIGAINCFYDISERKRAESELLKSEKRYRELLNALPVAVYTTDADGTITLFNEAADVFAGRHAQVGKDRWCITHRLYRPDGSSLPHDECPMAVTLRTGQPQRGVEAIAERPDGTRAWFVPHPTLVRDASGAITGGINVLVDITDRKQAEAALREQQQRLLKVEKMAAAGQLAAAMSHEINNQLSSITNLLYLLETRADLGESARILVTTAAAELARVSHIVKQSLSYYRVGTTPRDLDLGEIVNASLEIFSETFRKAGIELEPRLDRGAALLGFPDELRQVVDNLLLNALEAMPHGGRLKVSVHDSSDWKRSDARYGVRLTIADTGCGIAREHRWRIFEPFFTTKSEKGTGLGLWILRGIIAKHDGEMSLRSSDAKGRSGTVVSIFLPSNARRLGKSRISRVHSAA